MIAFQTLSLAHPLIGDLVAEGPPELEDAAFAGDLPWIDDAADSRNRASVGIARPVVLSRLLADLAARSFGLGLQDPQRRPGVAEWALRLHAASDATLTCPTCGATYYMNATVCPWCDEARPTFVLASFILSDPEAEAGAKRRRPSVATLALPPGETVIVTDRIARGRSGSAGQLPVLAMAFDGTRVSLRALDESSYRLVPPSGGKSVDLDERTREIDLRGASWRLHLGDAGVLHRVATFRMERARQA